MKILFLSQWFPYPPNNGSKIRIYNILRGLAEQHEITLVSFTTNQDVEIDTSPLRSLCREIHVVRWKPYNPTSLRASLGYFSLKPRYVMDTLSSEMKALIERVLSDENYDLAIASEMGMAGYASSFKGVPALLDELELGGYYQRYANELSPGRRMRNGLTWYKQRRYTAGLLKNFKAATVVSQPELDLLRRVDPGFEAVEVIPNCIRLEDYSGSYEAPQPDTLVFSGSFKFNPNFEAMQWFLKEVYPLVSASVSDVRLAITGDPAGRPLTLAQGVTLTGFLEDIRPLVASSWACLAPIHTGGGTRLKIIEAMALKTPVIATSKGAEGIEIQNGKNILIADTPKAFAQAVIELLKNPDLRRELSTNAFRLVQEKYDWAVVMPRFLSLVEKSASSETSRLEVLA
ncbi:MAG: glycosyltransferase family 4 protein [Omnitrophica WOR_2 bacterium]